MRPPAIVAVDRVDHVRMNGLRSAAVEQRRHVERARDVTAAHRGRAGCRSASAVRPSARAFAFISATKRGIEPRPTWSGEGRGGVVRARDERGDREVAHGEPLARAEVHRRLADRGGLRRDGDDIVEARVLERDEHRHQLRDARRRALARRGRARRGRRRPARRARRRRARTTGGGAAAAVAQSNAVTAAARARNASTHQRGTCSDDAGYQPAAAQISAASRAASAPAASRQSASVSR